MVLGVHTFLKSINLKVNVIARLEFETHNEATFETTPQKKKKKKKEKEKEKRNSTEKNL